MKQNAQLAVRLTAFAVLAVVFAHPAFAQAAGGINPTTATQSIVTMLLQVATSIAVIGFCGAGLACYTGRIHINYMWAAGVGTVIIACCAYISGQILGTGIQI